MYLILAKWVGGVLLGLMVAWIIYAGLIRPTTKPPATSSQKADSIINYTFSPKSTFGCMRFDVPKKEVIDVK